MWTEFDVRRRTQRGGRYAALTERVDDPFALGSVVEEYSDHFGYGAGLQPDLCVLRDGIEHARALAALEHLEVGERRGVGRRRGIGLRRRASRLRLLAQILGDFDAGDLLRDL